MPSSENLLNGEKVLWRGRQEWGPRPLLRTLAASVGGWMSIGFSVMWFQIAEGVDTEGSLLNWVGLLPGIMGVYQILRAFVTTYVVRGLTSYTLTNRRAIKTVKAFGRRQSSVLLADIPEIQLEQHSDGTATVLFGRDETVGSGDHAKQSYAFRFRFIRNASQVMNAVEKLRKYKHHATPDSIEPAMNSEAAR